MGIVTMTFLIVVRTALPLLPNQRVRRQWGGGNQPCVYGEGCAGDPAGLVGGEEQGGLYYA